MKDDSYIDVNSVLDKPEKWARESLRNDGLSDTFVDAWIQMDSGLDLEVAIELVTSESDYKLMLIRHIESLRDQLKNGNQSPMDWIWDGYLLAWFQFTGSMNESEKIWFSELQSERGGVPIWLSEFQSDHAKKPRNRTTLTRQSVAFVLERADFFPGALGFRDVNRQNDLDHFRLQYTNTRGQQLRRFRHYVGEDRRLYELGTIDVEVTTHYDERGVRPVSYEFFCNQTFRRECIVDATLRKIVKEVSRELGQE